MIHRYIYMQGGIQDEAERTYTHTHARARAHTHTHTHTPGYFIAAGAARAFATNTAWSFTRYTRQSSSPALPALRSRIFRSVLSSTPLSASVYVPVSTRNVPRE